jgi:hypothetical protein
MLRYYASANFVHLCWLVTIEVSVAELGCPQQNPSHPVAVLCDLARLFWTDGSCAWIIRFHSVFDGIVYSEKSDRLSVRAGTTSTTTTSGWPPTRLNAEPENVPASSDCRLWAEGAWLQAPRSNSSVLKIMYSLHAIVGPEGDTNATWQITKIPLWTDLTCSHTESGSSNCSRYRRGELARVITQTLEKFWPENARASQNKQRLPNTSLWLRINHVKYKIWTTMLGDFPLVPPPRPLI